MANTLAYGTFLVAGSPISFAISNYKCNQISKYYMQIY